MAPQSTSAVAELPRVGGVARRAAEPAEAAHTRHVWRRRVAKATRWLHIYGSMVSLALVLFFSITGVTLNHQEWFPGAAGTVERQTTVNPAWLTVSGGDGVDRLQVVEHLRTGEGLRGALADLRVDDATVEVVFKGPGYAASALIDRRSGRAAITESRMGLVAVVNDLHKGRDSGAAWKWAIDVSAVLLVFISLTGLVLLWFVHKHRAAGFILALAGTLVSYLVYLAWVP